MRCYHSIDSQIGVFVALHPQKHIIQKLLFEVHPLPWCLRLLGPGESLPQGKAPWYNGKIFTSNQSDIPILCCLSSVGPCSSFATKQQVPFSSAISKHPSMHCGQPASSLILKRAWNPWSIIFLYIYKKINTEVKMYLVWQSVVEYV